MWPPFFKSPTGLLMMTTIIVVLGYVLGTKDTQHLVLLAEYLLPESQTLSVASPAPTPIASPTSVLGLQASEAAAVQWFAVTKVSDGDTFKIDMNGSIETVRLVGINTPETVDPRRSVECFGAEASSKLKSLVEGQTVRLEPDTTQTNRDRYHRLLRFAFLPDGRDIGLVLLKEGYAHESLYSQKPHIYREQYLAAQNQAQTAQLGLWHPQACM